MTFPNILLSGGPRALLNDLELASSTLDQSVRMLNEVCPHPRDYVRIEDWEAARAEHWRRVESVEKVREEIGRLIGHLILGGVR